MLNTSNQAKTIGIQENPDSRNKVMPSLGSIGYAVMTGGKIFDRTKLARMEAKIAMVQRKTPDVITQVAPAPDAQPLQRTAE